MARSGSLLTHDDLPYRPCVGIMLVNREGLVFVGRRIDQTIEGWQMPQGGIDDGESPLEAARRYVDEIVTVTEEEIIAAMELLLTRAKLYVEGSGAAATAALLAGKVRLPAGAVTVAIVSGGNVDPERACGALARAGR